MVPVPTLISGLWLISARCLSPTAALPAPCLSAFIIHQMHNKSIGYTHARTHALCLHPKLLSESHIERLEKDCSAQTATQSREKIVQSKSAKKKKKTEKQKNLVRLS